MFTDVVLIPVYPSRCVSRQLSVIGLQLNIQLSDLLSYELDESEAVAVQVVKFCAGMLKLRAGG